MAAPVANAPAGGWMQTAAGAIAPHAPLACLVSIAPTEPQIDGAVMTQSSPALDTGLVQTVSTILPMCWLVSMRAWASLALAIG